MGTGGYIPRGDRARGVQRLYAPHTVQRRAWSVGDVGLCVRQLVGDKKGEMMFNDQEPGGPRAGTGIYFRRVRNQS